MTANDVIKIFKDLELKAVGLDQQSQKMQEGYFVAFRGIGLPIHPDDYSNPFTPAGGDIANALNKAIKDTPPADPKSAPKTGSGNIDVTKAYAANVAADQQAYLNTYALVNDKLQLNNQYAVMPGSSHLDDTWFAIITGANGIPTTSQISDALKQAYASAQALLQDANGLVTPQYMAYQRYRDAYNSKVRAKNKAYADAFTDPTKLAQWPANGKTYQDDVDFAWNNWVGLGFKNQIDQALATLGAQGTDPSTALISRAKQTFQNCLFNFPGFGNIPYTMLSPNSWYDDTNDDGWNEYTSTDYQSQSHYTASQTSYGASGGFSIGLWSGGASFDHSDSSTNSSYQMNNLQIKFSYAVVDIYRPWLDTTLLNLGNWFLIGDYKKNCISNGTMAQQVPTDGTEPLFLPSLVTSLILVKDVTISWDNCQEQWAAHTESNSASASVGCMFFTASAHYSHAQQSRDFECTMDDQGLHIPGIQLVGYVSQIMPGCPQKNSSDYMQKPGN